MSGVSESVAPSEGRQRPAGEADAGEAAVRGRETLFIVGSPRSGTTWVQLLLSEHPGVVTAPETQVFAYYLDHFLRQWRHEHRGPGAEYQGKAGLSRLLSEEEFDDLCRSTARRVLERIAARDPDAGWVVEKSPRHALHVEWIHRLFPDARFLHVVRDPRDAVSSLMAAARSWGRGWAPRHPVDAARMWKRNVESALRGRKMTDRYREVRYEDLKRDAVEELAGILDWLGLKADRSFCERAVEARRLARMQEKEESGDDPLPASRSPAGFFRKGEAGGWKDELSASTVRMIEEVCRETMDALGYRATAPRRATTRVRIGLHDGLRRVREAIDWQLQRLLWWI